MENSEKLVSIKTLLELLSLHKGGIVSTASLDTYNINQARASGRMFVDEHSLGFVWMPDIKRIPQTEDEVEFFEKWFPLENPLPDSLKDCSFLFDDKRLDKAFGICRGAKCTIPNCKVCKNEMF